MNMSNKGGAKRHDSQEDMTETFRDEGRKKLSSILMGTGDINYTSTLSSRHSISSPEATMHSLQIYTDETGGRRSSSSRASTSSSPAPYNDHHTKSSNGNNQKHRRNSDIHTDSLMSNNGHNNSNECSSSSSGANPLTKNVGTSVNLGKLNVKSNSSSTVGAQHITPNGHQHQQQHTPGTTSGMAVSTTNIHNSNNNNSSNNSAAINLGHGHIGTIAGPPSVSISSGLGLGVGPSLSSSGVNHNSSLSTLPAVNAPTTCTNKGVPASHNQQQQQHLPIPSPTTNHPRMSPHSPNLPIMNNGLQESLQTGAESSKNGNSSSSTNSSTSSSSRNGGNGNNKNNSAGIRTGPNSPSASSTTSSSSCSGGSKGETQSNVPRTNPNGSNASDGSNNNNSANRIVSQNVNGTLALTGVPSNECELQLFRVLQRANLLSYFDVMIELGGDDVQQLCEAGEEEFLEIMALIGMAAKPLHVRRLQKALQEWMTQPSLFQAPVLPPGYPISGSNSALQALPQLVGAAGIGQLPVSHLQFPVHGANTPAIPLFYPEATATLDSSGTSDPKGSPSLLRATYPSQSSGVNHLIANNESITGNPLSAVTLQQNPQLAAVLDSLSPNSNINQQRQLPSRYSHTKSHHNSSSQNYKNRIGTRVKERNISGGVPSPVSMSDIKIPVDQLIPSHFLETRIRTSSEFSSPASSIPGSPHPEGRNSVSPVPLSLQDYEVQKLADAAIHHIRSLPPSVAEPKFSSKRKTSADYELILRLSEYDPRRMDEVRRVAAVYGRADAKRKTLKPLSMHELAINEAAAQLCKHVPAFLTKREELLSLSRQVLRESGLPYAAVSSTFSIPLLATSFVNSASSNNINNNDVNTKSKYEEIGRNHQKTRESSEGNNGSIFGSFHAKRFRLDGSSGIEIQEYSHSRPPSIQDSPSPPSGGGGGNNGMQITELRCLPPRRSPSDDSVSLPLELVTVTSSDLRKSGACKTSSISSIDSNSPPIRRSHSVESNDLSNSNNSSFPHFHGMRIGHQEMINAPSSVKFASIPVSGGSIGILNHNGNSNSNRHFNHHLHHHYNGGTHGGMTFIPIKSESTIN